MDTASDKALQRFAELMIEKIKQVEDNWQKPWFGIKGGGLPQNIEGRTYNGVNSFMLFLLSEKEQYSLPVYMTFMQAKDSGLNILKGEKSFPVIYWNFSVRDKNGKKIWENDILMCNGNPDDLVKAVFGEFRVIDIITEQAVDTAIGWHYEVIPTDAISRCEPFCYPMPLNHQYVKRCEMKVIGNIYDNP